MRFGKRCLQRCSWRLIFQLAVSEDILKGYQQMKWWWTIRTSFLILNFILAFILIVFCAHVFCVILCNYICSTININNRYFTLAPYLCLYFFYVMLCKENIAIVYSRKIMRVEERNNSMFRKVYNTVRLQGNGLRISGSHTSPNTPLRNKPTRFSLFERVGYRGIRWLL